jgi:uncharacterized repeat protein (TIGR03803 family)
MKSIGPFIVDASPVALRQRLGVACGVLLIAGLISAPVAKAQYREVVLHSFTGDTTAVVDPADPQAGLVMDEAGNLYGTTAGGGTDGYGTVYKLDPSNSLTVLHSFLQAPDGANSYGALALDPKVISTV